MQGSSAVPGSATRQQTDRITSPRHRGTPATRLFRGGRRKARDPGMMTSTAEPFRLRTSDGRQWIMHPPADPYTDGYVRTADVVIRADGVTACTTATLGAEPIGTDLAGFPAART
jgi:hypothetical protein